MKTGQTHPEGKAGKWWGQWLKTLFMDGDAISSSWEFPLLEELMFHVQRLFGLIGCCVAGFGSLAGHFRGDRWTGGESEMAILQNVTSRCGWFPEGRRGIMFPSTSLTVNGTHIPAHVIFYPLIWWLPFTILSYPLSSVSSGKQATHKDVKEYFESSVEWDAGVSWYNSRGHDHEDTKVGAQSSEPRPRVLRLDPRGATRM